MVDVVSDLVHETTTTTGTGDKTLGNVAGKRSFNTAFSTGGTNVFIYYMAHRTASEYQWGLGHLSSSSVLVSDTILGSSNAGAAVNFSAGTIDVTNDVPAINQLGMCQRVNGLTPHENLIVKYINATTVDVDADAVTLFNPQGLARRFLSLNESPAITASGANGLDTGSEGSSRFYHIWAIGKEDGTLDTLLSESATAPTMPAGYTYKGYLGAVYNTSGSDFRTFYQLGNLVNAVPTAFLSAGTQTNYTAISTAAVVPATARTVVCNVFIYTSSGTAACRIWVAPAGSGTTDTYGSVSLMDDDAGTTGSVLPFESLIDIANQQVVYRVSGTNVRADLNVVGWKY